MSMTIPEQGCSIHKAEYSRNVSKCDLWCWALASFWMKCLSVWSRRLLVGYMAYLQAYSAGQSGWTATQCGIHRTGEKRNLVHQNILMNSTVTLLGICNKRTSFTVTARNERTSWQPNRWQTVLHLQRSCLEDTIFACANPVHSGIPRAAKSTSQFGGYSRCTKWLTHTTHTQDTCR